MHVPITPATQPDAPVIHRVRHELHRRSLDVVAVQFMADAVDDGGIWLRGRGYGDMHMRFPWRGAARIRAGSD